VRYIATGKILPERADIRFPPIEWRIPDEGSVVAHCDASQVTIVLDLPAIDGWATAYLQARHFGLMTVGTLGLALGGAYSIELVQVMAENGNPHVFGAEAVGRLPEETLRLDQPETIFTRGIELANKDVHFRLAIRDYLRAIEDAVDCAMHCDRALDALEAGCAARDGTAPQPLEAVLGIEPGAIDRLVRPYATPVRVGPRFNAPPTDNDMRWRMLRLVREALLKYLDRPLTA